MSENVHLLKGPSSTDHLVEAGWKKWNEVMRGLELVGGFLNLIRRSLAQFGLSRVGWWPGSQRRSHSLAIAPDC